MAERMVDLHELACRAMLERGLEPYFTPPAAEQARRAVAPPIDPGIEDLRAMPWCSIDNDDSRDLDQLSVAQPLGGGAVRVLVAIADVDGLVRKGDPLDRHAARNTTSVYTAGGVFPMLPDRLSTDLTSLNHDQDRAAMVVAMDVGADGTVAESRLMRAAVRSIAKLAYPSVAAWLEGRATPPPAVAASPVLAEQLRIQDEVAGRLRSHRREKGALELAGDEARAVVRDGKVVDLERHEQDRAQRLIEDLMVAANGATARFLAGKRLPVIRRVVREPKRWDRIVELASRTGTRLPPAPDAVALEAFLVERRRADPLRFQDLSLAVVKLLGKGEYVMQLGGEPIGHFALATRDYTHSTAPNRRYPDLITQRLVKAALSGAPCPYGENQLADLATHCTAQEDAATKVERRLRKSAAALLLSHRIGERFDAIVTGASDRGTWVRTLRPPAEGMVVQGAAGMDVGDEVGVRLLGVDVERGFIDFAR